MSFWFTNKTASHFGITGLDCQWRFQFYLENQLLTILGVFTDTFLNLRFMVKYCNKNLTLLSKFIFYKHDIVGPNIRGIGQTEKLMSPLGPLAVRVSKEELPISFLFPFICTNHEHNQFQIFMLKTILEIIYFSIQTKLGVKESLNCTLSF